MDLFWQDMRQGARMMVRKPWFTLVAVIVLAFGIGPNAAIFSVVNTLMLTPLPYDDPDTIVRIAQTRPGPQGPLRVQAISTDDFQDWRASTQTLEAMAFYAPDTITLTGQLEPVRLSGASVSPALFPLLRARPLLGGVFAAEHEKPGNNRVVLLSQTCWEQRFNADRSLIGKPIKLEGNDYVVLGIMPRGFDFPVRGTEYWVPFALSPPQRGGNERRIQMLPAIARLKPGVAVEQAQVEGNTFLQQTRKQDPRQGAGARGTTLQLMTLQEQMVAPIRPALLALLWAVGLVLLIACANIANLLLTRAAGRQKELSIRAALGAGRWRLARQLLTESSMLSLLGGGAGLLLGFWGVVLLPKVSPGNLPRVEEIHIDLRVLAFTLGLSLLTGLLFGLAPALKAARLDLVQALKESGAQTRAGLQIFRHNKTKSLLAILEYALALTLLIGAGLLMNSFLRLINQNPGYDPKGLLTFQISLPRARYPQPSAQIDFHDRMLESLRRSPGVLAAGITNLMPMSTANMRLSFNLPGQPPPPDPSEAPTAGFRLISPGFFKAMAIPILQGRDFGDLDREETAAAVIVNQALVRRYFGGTNPIGRPIELMKPCEIIGVVGDVKPQGLDSEPQPEVFLSTRQFPQMVMMAGPLAAINVAVRTTGNPMDLVPALESKVRALDKDLPVFNVLTMEQRVSDSVAQPRFLAALMGIFAVTALVMAVVGIYSVLSCQVAQCTREIGIRMALGAQPADVLRLIVGQGVALAAIGIAIGLGGAWAGSRFISSMLFGVRSTDSLTYVSISALMVCVALVAAFIPARRATAVDPVIALRQE
jgi:putative ABC transport system permease protein